MKIAILGAGNIGGSLGRVWAAHGEQIAFGVRDPAKPELQQLVAEIGPNASAGSVADAIAGAKVVIFAIPGGLVAEVAAQHAAELVDKILIDATNNLRTGELSAVGTLAAHAPTAHIFRAFNSIGWENIVQPRYGSIQADLIYCGPPGPARETVEILIADTGLRPIYVGDLSQTPVVDALARLWFALAFGQSKGRRVGFRVLTAADDQAG
jgi:hypothetical protein